MVRLIYIRTFFKAFREDHELMHSCDLQKLEGVLSQSHLEEMNLLVLLGRVKSTSRYVSIPMTFCCNICTKHSPLQCLGSSTSTSTFKFFLDSPVPFLMMQML